MQSKKMILTEPVSIVSFWINLFFFSFNSLGVISVVAGLVVSFWTSSATFNTSSIISIGGVAGVLGSRRGKKRFYWPLASGDSTFDII